MSHADNYPSQMASQSSEMRQKDIDLVISSLSGKCRTEVLPLKGHLEWMLPKL